jgi:hypothetical protein
VTGDATFTSITVRYNEPIGDSALTTGNYQLAPAAAITAATRADLYSVVLTTAKMNVGADYTLTINNVQDTSGNAIAPNTQKTFKTFVYAAGRVSHKFWADHNNNNVQALIDDPRFPDAPTWQGAEPAFEYGPNGSNESGSNYGNQLFCWFTPAVTGSYTFIISGDDECRLYLSPDDNPANKKYIAQEPQWNNARDWNGTARRDTGQNNSDTFAGSEWDTLTINLTAGNKYYLEALHSEGGGGDSVGVTFRIGSDPIPANGTAPALTGALIGTYLDPNGAVVDITEQPQDTVTGANTTATFSVTATGSSAYGTTLTYQWQKTAAGGATFSDIAGATGATYTTPLLTTANSGEKYRVVVGVLPITVNSAEATLTVNVDTTPPTITRVDSDQTFTKIVIGFNEPVTAPTATTPSNYQLSGGATTAAVLLDQYHVRLAVSAMTPDTDYTLTVSNVQDLSGNPIAPNTAVRLHSWVWTPGKMTVTYWWNMDGTAVAALTDNVRYPLDSSPFAYAIVDGYNSPDVTPSTDNFGAVVSGYITPATTGTYVFFISADDNANLYLSTDESPLNKKLIAQEPEWQNALDWNTTDRRPAGQNRSDTFAGNEWGGPITLTQGTRYYTEIIYKEGGVGDHAGATWIPAGSATPANGATALVGDLVGTYAPMVVTEFDPSLMAVITGGNVTITWDTGTLVGSGTVDGTYAPVTGATSPYTPPAGTTMFYQVTQ